MELCDEVGRGVGRNGASEEAAVRVSFSKSQNEIN